MSIDLNHHAPSGTATADHLDLWLEDDPTAEQLPDVVSASATYASIATYLTYATFTTVPTYGTLSTYATGFTSVQ